MASPKIPEGLQTFLRHARSLHPANNPRRENGFAKEFQQLKDMSSKLKKNPEYVTHNGELEYNRPKNRYKDIMPFDHNRIILPTLAGVPGSDYINGNYVKGADGETAYLALQGPLPKTVDDFWRLIASHRCQIVIMVCREIEMGKLKCKRYWPESKDEILTFAGLKISLIDESNPAEGFVMRTMCMKSGEEEMTVTQLQYTAWPDHDVPRSAAPLIELNRTLRAAQGNRKQVVLIHCSAGCGRTGTIIAVDYAWTLLKMKKTDNFSVYEIVADLRRQRMAMVQTKEQYALVYKAVEQLVQEELEREKLKSHTYVNVEIPDASQSPTGREDYENCEFALSVSRWKQSDLQNGLVPRAPAPLPAQKPTKPKPKPQLANKPALPRSQPDGAAVAQPSAPIHHDYVNIEYNRDATKNKPASPVRDADGAILAQPLQPAKSNASYVNSNEIKGGNQNSVAVQQKSPTTSDYEVVAKKLPMPAAASSRNAKAPQGNKPVSAEYEFPSACAPRVNKEQAKHVPEGLLIDLGDDVPPVPTKRHSVGSVTKDGPKSRYENFEVPVQSSPKPGVSFQKSSSSPNVLDDSWLLGLKPTVNESPAASVHLENAKGNADSRAFHTVPNRRHADPGPKRCPLTTELFQEPSASGGVVGASDGPGLGLMQSSQGQYCLVGAPSSPSPTAMVANPQFVPQSSQASQPQKVKHTQPVDGRRSPQPGWQGGLRTPVGTYSLVGIPEVAGQSPVLHTQTPVATATAVKSVLPKENIGAHVEVKSNLNIGLPVPVTSGSNIGNPVAVKSNSETSVSVEVKGNSNVARPVEVKGNPIVEASYEIVGQRQPPSVLPYKPRNASLPSVDYEKGPKEEKQNAVAGNKFTPDASQRGQADGAPLEASDVAVAPDLYATVVPRNTRDKSDSKDRNSANVSTGSSNLRPLTSSGSIQSRTSTSSEEGDTPPVIPKKTNEAFLVPGEEPYEHVQQTNRGTLDRFRKMMKSTSKGSLPKRSSDGLQPHGLPRSNSSGTGTTRLDELGYKKRFAKPTGPRSCPADWPSFGHLGL